MAGVCTGFCSASFLFKSKDYEDYYSIHLFLSTLCIKNVLKLNILSYNDLALYIAASYCVELFEHSFTRENRDVMISLGRTLCP